MTQSRVEESWEQCRGPLLSVLENVGNGMTFAIYMSFHSGIVNALDRSSNADKARLYELVGELYECHFSKLAESLRGLSAHATLQHYCQKWMDFQSSRRLFALLFSYLNKVYVNAASNLFVGQTRPLVVDLLALKKWREYLARPLMCELFAALLELIKREREGESEYTALIRSFIQSFVRLGDCEVEGERLRPYRELIEEPLLHATELYYQAKSTLKSVDLGSYTHYVCDRTANETRLARIYLHPSSEAPIIKCVEKALITNYADLLISRFDTFVGSVEDEPNVEELKILYTLLKRVDLLRPLAVKLEDHVRVVGRQRIADDAENARKQPDVFVKILLLLFHRYVQLVATAFASDDKFSAVVDRAFRDVVNENAIADSDRTLALAPQHLAAYSNQILQKGAKFISDEELLRSAAKDICSLLKYVADKDVFIKLFNKYLSRRLINQTSGNDDTEAIMLECLLAAFGFLFVTKSKTMMQDISVSKDTLAQFRTWTQEGHDIQKLEFRVFVLTPSRWPLPPAPSNFNPPQEFSDVITAFNSFYMHQFSGRRLTFSHHMSKAELRARCIMKGKLVLMVSSYQAAVLLCYNASSSSSLSFKELSNATALVKDVLKGALFGLHKSKVLSCAQAHDSWDSDTQFALNLSLKLNVRRLNCDARLASTPETNDHAAAAIKMDRELTLQASIMRIMKAGKSLNKEKIHEQCVVLLARWFDPTRYMSRVLQLLVEKEYLCMSPDNPNVYTYIA